MRLALGYFDQNAFAAEYDKTGYGRSVELAQSIRGGGGSVSNARRWTTVL